MRVPATSANLGPGFDCLGLALDLSDDVSAEVTDSGSRRVAGEGAGEVPPRRAAPGRAGHARGVRGARRAAARAAARAAPTAIPHGRGLGSSAAAIVAGLVARALAHRGRVRAGRRRRRAVAGHRARGTPRQRRGLRCCGGFTMAWQRPETVVRAEPARPGRLGIEAVAAGAARRRASTEAARGLLPASVPHADAAANAGRAALLVRALTRPAGPAARATEDLLHQRTAPRDAGLARRWSTRCAARRRSPRSISGAGPDGARLRPPRTAAGAVRGTAARCETAPARCWRSLPGAHTPVGRAPGVPQVASRMTARVAT